MLSVSPWMTSMSSGGMPSSWATICANVVSWPCPCALHGEPHLRLAGGVHPQVAAVGHAEAEDVHVLARAGADALGEERDADAHVLALGPLLGLLLAQVVVAGDAHRDAHGLLVVARVVLPAGGRRVRELLGTQQVLQPQLGGVHLQLGREAVDDALDRVDRLGDAERAGVGDAAGGLVRVDGLHGAVGGGVVVGAGEDVEEAGRVLRRLRDAVERAVVGEDVDLDRRGSCPPSSTRSRPFMW